MIRLEDCSVSLDRRERGADIDFISHAHSDHISAARKSRGVLSSDETAELIGAAYGIEVARHGGKGFELLDSGHMLGAKQLYIRDIGGGTSTVYSGDFQMQGSYACPPIAVRHADIAIVDSTYPYPEVAFEDHGAVAEDIVRMVDAALNRGIVLFTAFRTGKAQELIAIMNGSGIVPVVSRRISEANMVYRKHGVMLDYASAYEDDTADFERLVSHNFVGIVDTRNVHQLAARLADVHARKVSTAIASGLTKEFRFNYDMQFPLSSHADFRQAVQYIERVNPEMVMTYGKERELMARNLTSCGIEAKSFTDIENANLVNYLRLKPEASCFIG